MRGFYRYAAILKVMSKSIPQLLPSDLYEPTSKDKQRFAAEISLGLRQPGDPLLSKRARTVRPEELPEPRIQAVIRVLQSVASGQRTISKKDKKRRLLVGIAAPQIGELLRIVMVDTSVDPERKKPGKLECFINPEILWRSRETDEGREGCFSTGLVYGLVRRPIAIKLRAMMPDGRAVERVFEGFTARIIQHEVDHLDGIRFPDRIKSDSKRHWVHTEEIDDYPQLINQWPRLCSKARWEQYKQADHGQQPSLMI